MACVCLLHVQVEKVIEPGLGFVGHMFNELAERVAIGKTRVEPHF